MTQERDEIIRDLLDALKGLLAETELTYQTQIMDKQADARAAIAKATRVSA